MSQNKILLLFLFFTIIDCKDDKNEKDFIESLIKEQKSYFVLYLIIFSISFILGLLLTFIFNEKAKTNRNIEGNKIKIKIFNLSPQEDSQVLSSDTSEVQEGEVQDDKVNNLNSDRNMIYKKETTIKADDIKSGKVNLIENMGFIQKLKKKINEKRNFCYNFTYNLSLIGRIIFTLLSLEGLFFIYNMIIQDILIFPGLLYDMENKIWFLFYFLYIIFMWYSSKLVIIPTYEFLNFPFLRYYNPFRHLNSFRYLKYGIKYKENENEDINSKHIFLINFLFSLIGVCFSIIFILTFFLEWLSEKNIKDIYEFFILIIIFINYISIFFCYFIFSIYYFLKNYFLDFFKCKCKCQIHKIYDENDNYPVLNLVYYNIYPYLDRNYKQKNNNPEERCKCECKIGIIFYWARFILKLYLLIFSIVAAIYFFSYSGNFFAYFAILNFVIISLSLSISFPFCFTNRKFCKKGEYKKEVNNIPLLISRVISLIVFGLCFLAFCFISIEVKDYEKDDEIYSKIQKLNVATVKKVGTHRNKTLHSFCYSGIHNMPIYFFIPFINDAYYWDKNKTTLNIENYMKLFYDDSYKIEIIGNLINNTEGEGKKLSKMIQYKVKNGKNEMTILSIKGTSFRRDMYLDMQLYFPAILLNLINTFSNLDQQKEQITYSFVEYGFSIPYRIFFKYFIVDKYMNGLIDAYDNAKLSKNVIIVGHSLGGGLAKIIGKYKSKQALSLSGPGMNAFHSLWKYEGISEYFDLTSIDIIPDLDLVPRVDISGGTIYRLLCLNTTINCHSKELSLCESMIMCRNPNAKEYCKNIALISDNDYEMLYNATEFDVKSKKKLLFKKLLNN